MKEELIKMIRNTDNMKVIRLIYVYTKHLNNIVMNNKII